MSISVTCLQRVDLYIIHTYVTTKKLQDEGGHAAVDSDQDVDAGQDHVGRAGDFKEERCWIHQRSYGPAVQRNTTIRS